MGFGLPLPGDESRARDAPPDDANLERFITARDAAGAYFLAPAVLIDGTPQVMTDLAILKRYLPVVAAADVGRNDVEWTALELVRRQDAE